MSNTYYRVCIPNTLKDFYDYAYPVSGLLAGTRVVVPFRKNLKIGFIIGESQKASGDFEIRLIEQVLDDRPFIDADMSYLYEFVANYYQSPFSQVLRLAIPKLFRTKETVVKPKLWEKYYPKCENDKAPSLPLALNPEQNTALSTISQAINQKSTYQCFVLQGITGSGKTEVYLQAIQPVIKNGQQVLILVPEIGLTPQLCARFQDRFQLPIAVLHSQLTDTARAALYSFIKSGDIQIVIGTRSAIFTPMPNLGLIVVDEEHDLSLKQMEGVRYHGRDVALIRASHLKIPIILGSATPSFETLRNISMQKYTPLYLTQKAKNTHKIQFQLVDLRYEPQEHGLSTKVRQMMQVHFERGEQVLVFINRRGFAPVLYCQSCSKMVDCKYCDSHMTYHKTKEKLICHHCGLMQKYPKNCPSCHETALITLGTGTQKLEQMFDDWFPAISKIRIDRDEVSGKDTLKKHLTAISNEEYQLLIGTQMLAKGHDFPNLTLVVILDIDTALTHPDYHATERLAQLLVQVSGRAGRGSLAGRVMIQTLMPQHPFFEMLLKYGYQEFAKNALVARETARLAPYQYEVLIRAKGKKESLLLAFLNTIKSKLSDENISVLGPAPAVMVKKQGMINWQLWIKSHSRQHLHHKVSEMRRSVSEDKKFASIRWSIDVDPVGID